MIETQHEYNPNKWRIDYVSDTLLRRWFLNKCVSHSHGYRSYIVVWVEYYTRGRAWVGRYSHQTIATHFNHFHLHGSVARLRLKRTGIYLPTNKKCVFTAVYELKDTGPIIQTRWRLTSIVSYHFFGGRKIIFSILYRISTRVHAHFCFLKKIFLGCNVIVFIKVQSAFFRR